MYEILEISSEISFNILIYHFKGLIPSISFPEFDGPMHIYNQLKSGDKTLSQVEEDKKFKSELGQITSRRPKDKSDDQKKCNKKC